MSRKERNNIMLDFVKNFILAIITAIFGIFAYIGINIDTISQKQTILAILAIICLIVIVSGLLTYFLKLLKEMEKM